MRARRSSRWCQPLSEGEAELTAEDADDMEGTRGERGARRSERSARHAAACRRFEGRPLSCPLPMHGEGSGARERVSHKSRYSPGCPGGAEGRRERAIRHAAVCRRSARCAQERGRAAAGPGREVSMWASGMPGRLLNRASPCGTGSASVGKTMSTSRLMGVPPCPPYEWREREQRRVVEEGGVRRAPWEA
jgi:hypothetical protein